MSRRIVYLALASAALIVTPAVADRECFENACQLPEPAEPRAQAVVPPEPAEGQEQAAQAQAEQPKPVEAPKQTAEPPKQIAEPQQQTAEPPKSPWPVPTVAMPSAADVVPPPAVARAFAPPERAPDAQVAAPVAVVGVPVPVTAHPQMVVDPAAPALRPQPRYADEARPQRFAPQPVQRRAVDTRTPARAPNPEASPQPEPRAAHPAVAAYPQPRLVPPALPEPRAAQLEPRAPMQRQALAAARAPQPAPAPAYGRAAIIPVPSTLHAEDGVVAPLYPYVRPDPSWKLCQLDHRAGQRFYHCGPYSYHPYGAYGYRPYGNYRPYRSAPVYAVAPDARIITIETDD